MISKRDFKDLENKVVTIKQLKSESGSNESQKSTIIGLGLKGINSTAEVKVTKSVFGMIDKVKHLINIVE
jgi:large subunit ribosomal protein L30